MSTAAELAGSSAADIASARLAFVAYLQELWPTLAIRGGPLADTILSPASDALAAIDTRALAVEASLDPETALAEGGYDEEVLNAALAGRGVTRIAAASSSGTAALKFSTDLTRSVVPGQQFKTADGVLFQISSSVRFLPTGSTATLSNDVVMVEDPAGGFVGTAPIASVETGETGTRPAGTALTAITAIDALTAAWTATDIAGGRDAETDAALLTRLPSATAPRSAASITGAEGLIRDAVIEISTTSAVKFGDSEMLRGRSVLSSQTPGRFDLWYRTADQPSRERIRVTATYIGLDGAFTSWRFALTVDEAPGRFQVEKIIQTTDAITATGYLTATLTPGFDTSGATDPPDIRSAADAAQSRFATAGGTFIDPDTPEGDLVVNDTKEYDVVCRLIPGIEVAQAAVEAADARAAGGDCLVRSAVPVMVSVTAVATPASGVTLTADQVAEAVARAINAAGISNSLSAAGVAARAITYLSAGTSLLLSSWAGIVYPADASSTIAATAGSDGLTVAANPLRNVNPTTVAYYCDPESVTASVT